MIAFYKTFNEESEYPNYIVQWPRDRPQWPLLLEIVTVINMGMWYINSIEVLMENKMVYLKLL